METKLKSYDYIHESVNNMEYTGCTYRIIQILKIGFESTNSESRLTPKLTQCRKTTTRDH